MIEPLPITHGDSPAPRTPPNAQVYLLNDEQVTHYWPRIEAELEAEPELWDKWWTLEAIFEGVTTGIIQVWVISAEEKICAVFMSHILCAPAGNIMQIFWIRGSLPDGAVNQMSLTLEHFAQHHRCFRICALGRKGWERKLSKLGVSVEGICMSRPVTLMTRN